MKTELEIADIVISNSDKLNSLCRICLTENTEKWVSLFDPQETIPIAKKIMLCAKVQIHFGDGLPNSMCEQCSKELDIVDNFRVKCEFSDTLLNRIYTKLIKNDDCNERENLTNHLDNIKQESPYTDCADFDDQIKRESSERSLDVRESNRTKNKRKKCKSQRSRDSIPLSEISVKVKKEKEIIDENQLQNSSDNSSEERNRLKRKDKKRRNKNYSCHVCNKALSSSLSLERHLQNMHNEEKNKSQIGTVSGFGPDRRFHCTECSYVTRFKTDLICHMRRHTGEKPYKCDICQRNFAQHATLTNHKKTHSDTMYYTCPECGKQFKYKNRFDRHKTSHTEQKLYNCSICGKGLKSQKILEEHMNRHYNIKNFNCETCGSTFVTFSEMTVHSRIHGTEKRFQCSLCEYRTFVKASLEKHMRRHTGERPYRCETCDWACYTKGELKIHTRKHTKEKNYSCPVCQSKFMSSSGVNKHMVRTHGVKFKWSDHKDRRVIK